MMRMHQYIKGVSISRFVLDKIWPDFLEWDSAIMLCGIYLML